MAVAVNVMTVSEGRSHAAGSTAQTVAAASTAQTVATGSTAQTVAIGSTSPTIAPTEAPDTGTGQDVEPEHPWDVIVWDDPVNLMSYVVYVFRKVFGYTEAVARKLMLDVHHKGKALVASEPREMAEFYVRQLHHHGLQATMQRST